MKSPHETPGEGALSAMAASLSGVRPPVVGGVAGGAQQLRRVTAALRTHPDPDVQEHVRTLDQYDAEGGDLNVRFGVKVKRGGAHAVPATWRRQHARDNAVRAYAATLPGPDTVNAHAKKIIANLQARDERLHMLRQEFGLPTSERQYVRILRALSRD